MDNGLSLPTAPPPVPPPPPPIAPPPPVMSFKGRAGANKGDKPAETKRKAQQQQQRLAVTLSDIKNVQLKTVNNVKVIIIDLANTVLSRINITLLFQCKNVVLLDSTALCKMLAEENYA